MTEQCSGRQGQLIIWAAAEAHRLRRVANGAGGAGVTPKASKATGGAEPDATIEGPM